MSVQYYEKWQQLKTQTKQRPPPQKKKNNNNETIKAYQKHSNTRIVFLHFINWILWGTTTIDSLLPTFFNETFCSGKRTPAPSRRLLPPILSPSESARAVVLPYTPGLAGGGRRDAMQPDSGPIYE